ncbi:MAG TPA: hypothetical protein PKL22_10570 [Saprospiraceae bacterium]|nr:hypothetical protein [Saprospiraceae bacterium]
MRKYSAAELFHFYITDHHWLHMDRNKMLLILDGIKKSINDLDAWQKAYAMVRDSTPDEIKEMRMAYYWKYGWKKDKDQIVMRRRPETVIFETINQN